MSQYRSFRHRLAALVTLGAFATAGCFVVDDTDSDDDDDEEGDAGEGGNGGSGGSVTRGGSGGSTAGTSAGGTTSTGGSETGGSETGGSETGGNAGAGPSGGSGGSTSTGGSPPTGGTGGSTSGAVMKFCNDLARGEMGEIPITLTLEFAGVTASALSGECTPVVPNACIAIPTGATPSVELREGAEVIISGSFPTLTVAAGDELFVLAAIDPDDMMPGVFADTFANIFGTSCASTDPVTAPPLMSRSADINVPSQWYLKNVVTPSVFRDKKSSLKARLTR